MSGSKKKTGPPTVGDIASVMEAIAPTALAQDWDNVGLLAGDPADPVRSVLLCIDVTDAVVAEAVERNANLVIAYHPPVFRPITSIRADARGTERVVFACIRHGISIYATHTALDAAEGGTNDVLAQLCGAGETEPIEYVDGPGPDTVKLVTFVPAGDLDRVADALFSAGAGHIGDYSHCSYRLEGHGTFLGSESTNPAVGRRGRLETVDDVRLETVVERPALPAVVRALVSAHPYEEPAYDIYPLDRPPVKGIGRYGRLKEATTLQTLAGKLKREIGAGTVEFVGQPEQRIERVVVVAGAAGSLPFRISLTETDAIVTGEMRHHDALTVKRTGCAAVILGHWASERPVLAHVEARIRDVLPEIDVSVSEADRAPITTA